MSYILLKLINMSITASYLLLTIILIRPVFKKMPKYITCILWGIAGIRLILPFSLESKLSLIPSTEPISGRLINGPTFDIDTGIKQIDLPVNDYLGDKYFEGVTISHNHGAQLMQALVIIWLIGMAVMVIYSIISCIKLKNKVAVSIQLTDNIWVCDNINTPFILGILRPQIYLPSAMSENERDLVLFHERAHLERKDHIWKPLGFLLLTVYWFNPLIWISYALFCRDIETACDQKALKKADKKEYSQALLNLSSPRFINACPLAFGETGVKKRIKSILKYKKPAIVICIIAIIICVFVAIGFLTDPQSKRLGQISSVNLGQKEITIAYKEKGNDYTAQKFPVNRNEVIATAADFINGIKISYSPISISRSENRDKTYSIEFGNTKINFNEDCTTVWIDDGVKPSYSYNIKEPNRVLDHIHWLMSESAYGATAYYTCYDAPFLLLPQICLYEDTQTFMFIFSSFSSEVPIGKYEIINGILTLTADSGEKYIFEKDGNSFIFNEELSSPLPKFKYEENNKPRSPIPNGSVFTLSSPF